MVGFTDSDWAGDPDDRKYTAGYVFILGVNSQNETILSAKFWVDIVAFSSIFKSFLSFYS